MRSCGALNGRGRIKSALTRLKTAVFAPIARAIVMMATAVKPGVLARLRNARRIPWIIIYTELFRAKGCHGIRARGTAGGKPAGDQSHPGKKKNTAEHGDGIMRADAVK